MTIIASDAHNLDVRIPAMAPGREVAEDVLGADIAWAMVRDRPAAISASKFAPALTVVP